MVCNYIISWKRGSEKGLDIVDKEKSTESHIVIRDGVEEIPSDVFKYNRKMTTITIPNSVKHIANEAFWGCESLVEIVIPDSVKSIGSFAFGKCTSLKNIVIPSSTKVDETAFEGNGVKKDETLLEKRRENDKFAEDEK